MGEKKLLVVIGASGVQGSSVVRAVMTDPTLFSQFSIRGVSRDPVAAAEKTQFPSFIEWAKADINDTESLQKALEGAHTLYGVTDYWQLFSADAEAIQGKAIADAAKAAGVQHLIWSSQYSAVKLTNGKYTSASHLDAKYVVSEYIEKIKGDDMVATHVCIPYYMSNLPRLFVWVSPVDGVKNWRYPWDADNTRIALVDAPKDTGTFVAGVMRSFDKDPASMNGRFVHAVSEFLTPNELGAIFKEVRGEELRYKEVSMQQFTDLLPPMLADLPNQMAMVREFGLYGKDEREVQPEHDKILGEGVKKSSWAEYLRRDWDEDVKKPMIQINVPDE